MALLANPAAHFQYLVVNSIKSISWLDVRLLNDCLVILTSIKTNYNKITMIRYTPGIEVTLNMLSKLGFLFLFLAVAIGAQSDPSLRFRLKYSEAIHNGPITGRAYIMISNNNEKEPRLSVGRTGIPFFGRDFENVLPGEHIEIDASTLGSPVKSLRNVPSGNYYVQGFISIYTEFSRSDGHTVWMHNDEWEGQQWEKSPNNLYSEVKSISLDLTSGYDHQLVIARLIPRIDLPAETQWVKRFRIKSNILTKFWGKPIYFGATVLLPRDYARETIDYPVVYYQGHFSTASPMRFKVGEDFHRKWIQDKFPRMIVVTFQDPTPYFDTSYSVNSVNVGPYGDALLEELIPEIENRFRIIQQPYARILTGGSTGGWEALAMQFFYPDFFGGTFAYAPDPVTFTNVEGINIYKDVNAFYKQHEWRRVPIANTRELDGEIRLTSEQRNRFELVSGTKGRSGEQLDIWSAVFGPLGKDGYFKPLFDKRTGEIDRSVAEYWRENYDLLHHLKQNWASLGPKLVGKIHIYCGDMDNFYLNVPVKQLQEWMRSTENPHVRGVFVWGDGQGHSFGREFSTEAERFRRMAEHVLSNRPDNQTHPWWEF